MWVRRKKLTQSNIAKGNMKRLALLQNPNLDPEPKLDVTWILKQS